jgi:hypothetical protein
LWRPAVKIDVFHGLIDVGVDPGTVFEGGEDCTGKRSGENLVRPQNHERDHKKANTLYYILSGLVHNCYSFEKLS